MDFTVLMRLNLARRSRNPVVHVKNLERGTDRVITEDEDLGGALGEAVSQSFRSGRSRLVEVDGERLFLNVQLPPSRMVIIGAVHISQALAQMALLAGFNVRIVDPRTAFATPERFPGIELAADWPADALKERPLDAQTALVALTHDPKIDDLPIAHAIRSGCFYVGALGSRKTHASRIERLQAGGLSKDDVSRVRAPIGLDIGAAGPAEIAVAILAEVIQSLRLRDISSPTKIIS
ncbi:XdhC family protein [Rhizobium giardinii]|uniref:XdhC family protein n=1 Tax=Rhizobium giardinii TaxID=56731 RepID=UPI000DDB130A